MKLQGDEIGARPAGLGMSDLLDVVSKHSGYQQLHPALAEAVGSAGAVAGRAESSRWRFMQDGFSFRDRHVLDIGANTGFFSISALLDGHAASVSACEGNPCHAEFLGRAGQLLGLDGRLSVENAYYDFNASLSGPFDVVMCLNVLHHLGDDFGDRGISIERAKYEMLAALNGMASKCRWMWFQLGFNWKGDRKRPLFASGSKQELIDYVLRGAAGAWSVERIGIHDPQCNAYEQATAELMERFDASGEFLNRPIFLLRSLRVGGADGS